MSNIVLYGMELSPPVRACLLTLKCLDIPFEFKVVDMFNLQHRSAEFEKKNPQQTVPVLDDNGNYIWDSHAICTYLVSKYGKDDSLYPKDLLKRALVDQRMYFEASILFMALRNITAPLVRKNVTVVMKEKTDNIKEGYKLLEKFLDDNEFVCGNTLTIADFSCISTITTLRSIIDIDFAVFPKISTWMARMAKLPYYEEANGRGAEQYYQLIKPKFSEIIM